MYMGDRVSRLAILGSTGSIGTQALDVVREMPDRFEVVALAAGTRVEILARQIEEFQPELAVVRGQEEEHLLWESLRIRGHGSRVRVLSGRDGLLTAAAHEHADMVLNGLVGSVGLEPTIEALRSGKDVALANKETLVVGGHLIADMLAGCSSRIFPVDSEHSAIVQCLAGVAMDRVRRLILTASGGPFRSLDRDELSRVTPDQALNHPNWRMGPRITVDCATMMNKGFEVVEARWLLGLPAESVGVVVHPESIVHSIVEFVDGSALAQLSYPDMRLPIQYALMRGERVAAERRSLDLPWLANLTFEAPDYERFPCLSIGYEAARRGGTFGAVVNAADEVAVSAFLDGVIGFDHIPRIISETLRIHRYESNPGVDEVLACDRWARRHASDLVHRIARGGM
jgi:1-deoxy-D-xylulose-5-phosphate reductoisomerase